MGTSSRRRPTGYIPASSLVTSQATWGTDCYILVTKPCLTLW